MNAKAVQICSHYRSSTVYGRHAVEVQRGVLPRRIQRHLIGELDA